MLAPCRLLSAPPRLTRRPVPPARLRLDPTAAHDHSQHRHTHRAHIHPLTSTRVGCLVAKAAPPWRAPPHEQHVKAATWRAPSVTIRARAPFHVGQALHAQAARAHNAVRASARVCAGVPRVPEATSPV
mmetsp:Transcript_11632/g.29792  ORF Transcript_11632/g.29792 Transcript_11632/m.29792 type:complete len:129 (-) Transcript_11632:1348-1734(-)